MFGIFKSNPIVKLEKQYYDVLEKAMEAQRSGNIRLYSELSEQADGLLKKINALKDSSDSI